MSWRRYMWVDPQSPITLKVCEYQADLRKASWLGWAWGVIMGIILTFLGAGLLDYHGLLD